MEKIIELFDKYENEYLKFDKIPFDDRPFESPDLCAFKIIHSLLKKSINIKILSEVLSMMKYF